MKLYVGNIAFSTTEGDLTELFTQVGSVQSAQLIRDRDTGLSRGFAFVELSNRSEGEEAINRFNNYQLDGRSLKVNEAKPQERNNNSYRDNNRFNNRQSRY